MSRSSHALERLIAATATPVPARRARLRRAAAEWVRLNATVPDQQESQWCWCAIALGVHRFYEPAFNASQCEVAAIILQRDDACADPKNSAIDTPLGLGESLGRLGNFRGPRVDAALSFDEVRAEIDRGAPVGVRIQWHGEDVGHFVLITGYLAGLRPRLAIADPKFDDDEREYDAFVTAYLDRGAWRNSYRTQSHLD